MTTPFAGLLRGARTAKPDALPESERDTPTAILNRGIVGHALLVGIAGDALLHEPGPGVAFPLLIAIVAVALVSLVWRAGREVPREASFWLTVAVLAASAVAWRDAPTLQFVNTLGTVGALTMAAIALNDSGAALLAARLRDTLWGAAAIIRSTVAGIVPLALQECVAAGSRGRWGAVHGGWRPAIRAALIAAALLLVFGSLLRDADPIFASIVSLPEVDVGTIIGHLVGVGFFAWVMGGWSRGALDERSDIRRAPDALPFTLGSLDVTTALGTLNLLFGAFVATQLGWFFGGERFLHERTGLTAAAYAREGFFQMLWVVVLVVPLLLLTRAALRPGRDLARRHTALALPLVGLLAAIILSAVLRMRLYVHYYGLTTERFYPLVFMGWLAVVVAWLALTVLRGNGRLFVAGAMLTGYATLAMLDIAAPDVIVAHVNLARAERGAELDLPHLAGLSGEAAALATAAVTAPAPVIADPAIRAAADQRRCSAATELLARWGPESPSVRARETRGAAWRYWNAGEANGMRVVADGARAIRAVQRATCRHTSGRPVHPT